MTPLSLVGSRSDNNQKNSIRYQHRNHANDASCYKLTWRHATCVFFIILLTTNRHLSLHRVFKSALGLLCFATSSNDCFHDLNKRVLCGSRTDLIEAAVFTPSLNIRYTIKRQGRKTQWFSLRAAQKQSQSTPSCYQGSKSHQYIKPGSLR